MSPIGTATREYPQDTREEWQRTCDCWDSFNDFFHSIDNQTIIDFTKKPIFSSTVMFVI